MPKKSLSASMAAKLNGGDPAEKPVGKAQKPSAPSRKGTKAVGGHFPHEVARQLKILGAENDRTNQSLLAEALNLLFEKYGKAPIAEE